MDMSCRSVVVRKSRYLPVFDEEFASVAGGWKQWLEHLRYRGYHFDILENGFVFVISSLE